jgi:glucosamine--fructose-6-phosphate aminotransferase (isomerizing)
MAAIGELEGAYALGIISRDEPHRLIAARKGSPLVVGVGIEEHFIGSDVLALAPVTHNVIYLEDGDVADLRRTGYTIYDASGKQVERPVRVSEASADSVDRGQYRSFTEKEIFEQPKAVADTLEGRLGKHRILEEAFGVTAGQIFDNTKAVQIIACGTSFHAGSVARYWIESLAGLPCNVEIASEYRYRKHVVLPDTLVVTISQSGETADTLAALQQTKKLGYGHSLAICNVPESSLVRESELTLLTRAGPEIGVASTKAFVTQLTALLLLTIALARRHGLTAEKEKQLVEELEQLPGRIQKVLELSEEIRQLSERFVDKQHALFLGRGVHYPIAMEGALKLKEISYIHAESYAAGELKHGPLALVDADMPVIAVAPNDELLEKLKSNLQEVRARGGELYVFSVKGTGVRASNTTKIRMPEVGEWTSPILYTVPLQLLAYYVALAKGTDVDQPRNLAKSVTVE